MQNRLHSLVILLLIALLFLLIALYPSKGLSLQPAAVPPAGRAIILYPPDAAATGDASPIVDWLEAAGR